MAGNLKAAIDFEDNEDDISVMSEHSDCGIVEIDGAIDADDTKNYDVAFLNPRDDQNHCGYIDEMRNFYALSLVPV